MPSRILALDHGTKRIGVALSDELGWTAQPLETYERQTLDLDIAHILDLVRSRSGEGIAGAPAAAERRRGPGAGGIAFERSPMPCRFRWSPGTSG
jgi:putative Holliday junction resolvase